MQRVTLTDGTGRWFNQEAAAAFLEGFYRKDGARVSRATNDPERGETLYRTAGGSWILWAESRWIGESASITEVTPGFAARWLLKNEQEPSEDLLPLVRAWEIP